MKFCPKCGTQCEDDEIFCHNCGNQLDNNDSNANGATYTPANSNASKGSDIIGLLGLIFSILGGCIGLILDIVALSSASSSEKGKKYAKIGIGIFIAEFVISIIVSIILVATGVIGSNM